MAGSVGPSVDAFAGSTVNISGGEFGIAFGAFTGSEVNLIGTEFLLNGAPLDLPETGVAFPVAAPGATLSGTLADGSFFSFDLNASRF